MVITTNYFLYFVILCVGAAIGALVERFMRGRSSPPPALPPVEKNNLPREGDLEVMSAWKTLSNKIWLEMDGKRLEDKDTLQPEQRQRLVSLVMELRPWLETPRPAAATAQAAPVEPALPQAPAPRVEPQPVQPAIALPPLPADKKIGASVVEEAKPAPVLDSIIQQIDKVLQAKLISSPFKDRGIQLVEGPGGIVIVKDGINRYEGVDAISDPEVKNIIRQAVSDWEEGAR